jgi:hypothetical protein
MTSRDFCFWLQGFFEISGDKALSAEQGATVRKHLALVFKHKIDPSMGPQAVQQALNEIHHGPSQIPGGDLLMRC